MKKYMVYGQEMKVIARIDYNNKLDLHVGRLHHSVYNFDSYYDYTYSDDKYIILELENKFWVIDNSKMYDENYRFLDELNLSDHQKFSTEEEALMYATSCV